MNWSIIIAFGIGLGAYLLFLLVFALIKYFKNKKAFKKEIKNNVEEQTINEDNKSQK